MSHTVEVIYKSVFDVTVFLSDLTSPMKAERRAALNRSTSLLDLSTSRKTNNDPRHAAGSRLPSASVRPVPDYQSELKTNVKTAETDVARRSMDAKRRRVTMDVTTSRQLPRMMISSLNGSGGGASVPTVYLQRTVVDLSLIHI